MTLSRVLSHDHRMVSMTSEKNCLKRIYSNRLIDGTRACANSEDESVLSLFVLILQDASEILVLSHVINMDIETFRE